MYYVAHRLFAHHDRAVGAQVAAELARYVDQAAIFLPFCDTDEENLVVACKGRRLFELDAERLRRLAGMIAVLHGPSLDDGVCMEMGFAAALGVPVVILTTDFQTYGLREDGPSLEFPDPLVQVVASEIVRAHCLAPARAASGDRYTTFLRRNTESLLQAARAAVERLLKATTSRSFVTEQEIVPRVAFLEPSPYMGGSIEWAEVADAMREAGWTVQQRQRLEQSGAALGDALDAAKRDWQCLATTSLLVVDVNGPETPPGAALMIGASLAASRPVLAHYSDSLFTFAAGREPNFRNLMIQYSSTARFRSLEQLREALATACRI